MRGQAACIFAGRFAAVEYTAEDIAAARRDERSFGSCSSETSRAQYYDRAGSLTISTDRKPILATMLGIYGPAVGDRATKLRRLQQTRVAVATVQAADRRKVHVALWR
jgi:hypothetical protein